MGPTVIWKEKTRIYGTQGVSNNYLPSLCNILDALKILSLQLISQVLSNAMYTNYFIIFLQIDNMVSNYW